jgi:hypothetical protein
VTESEWLNATDPGAMLAFLHENGRASDRKLRLFAVACCRRIWPLLLHEASRWAVEVGERFADSQATGPERAFALQLAINAQESIAHASPFGPFAVALAGFRSLVSRSGLHHYAAALAAQAAEGPAEADYAQHRLPDTSFLAAEAASWAGAPADDGAGAAEYAAQSRLLRDIFGTLPFRPVGIDAAWLSWKGGLVRHLADVAYRERELPAGILDVARLAVLADALEEAGCSDAELLGHLRGPGLHVRGCFAVDAILGKS